MNSHRLIALAGSALLPLLVTGCVSGTRAVPSASQPDRSEALGTARVPETQPVTRRGRSALPASAMRR